MFSLDPEEYLIREEEYIREQSDPDGEWAAWQKRQNQYQATLKINPLYLVSTTTHKGTRYCGGAEFDSYHEAIAFIENNPTKRGFQGISCQLPKFN